MDKNDILSIQMSQKIDNSFGICMGRKRNVLDLHFDLIPFFVNV